MREGLIVMDDGGSIVGTGESAIDRKSWVALIIAHQDVPRCLEQVEGFYRELEDRYGVAELHAYELFQRKGSWADVPLDQLKAIVAATSSIIEMEAWPIVVQTFWTGNASQNNLLSLLNDEGLRTFREIGIDVERPEHLAFAFCAFRCRNFLDGISPGSRWKIVADEGIKAAGQRVRLPFKWQNGTRIEVEFADSRVFKLLQMADFVAFFTNRQQQIHHRAERTPHDEELLDILGGRWNYVNIPAVRTRRQWPL